MDWNLKTDFFQNAPANMQPARRPIEFHEIYKNHEIEVNISDLKRILKTSNESMDFTDLSP